MAFGGWAAGGAVVGAVVGALLGSRAADRVANVFTLLWRVEAGYEDDRHLPGWLVLIALAGVAGLAWWLA